MSPSRRQIDTKCNKRNKGILEGRQLIHRIVFALVFVFLSHQKDTPTCHAISGSVDLVGAARLESSIR